MAASAHSNPSRIGHPFRIVVLLSGRGSNFQALLKATEDGTLPVTIALVVSDQSLAPGLKLAQVAGIPTAVVPRLPKQRTNAEFNTAIADKVAEANPDLIVLAGYMRVLTGEFVSRFPNKIINMHPSLLPAFKGLEAQQQALDAGVRFSGCTVHFVIEELDSGPMIAQAVVPVLPNDTSETLSARILVQEHKLLPAVVSAIARGKVRTELRGTSEVAVIEGEENAEEPGASMVSLRL